MSDYIVEMKHITKRFPGIVANDDVTLQIKKGEIFALLGENGAGKSTLMSMLFGMYEPDDGEIFIRGKKEKIDSPIFLPSPNLSVNAWTIVSLSSWLSEVVIKSISPESCLSPDKTSGVEPTN